MSDLAENLARLRKARDVSQEELAARAGVGVDTVARIERGTRTSCRPSTINSLAAALGVTTTRLLSGPDDVQGRAADPQALTRIRQAVTSTSAISGLSDPAASEGISISDAGRQTTLAWHHYVAGRHTEPDREPPRLGRRQPRCVDGDVRQRRAPVGEPFPSAHRQPLIRVPSGS
jgi:transcriptional regulator with XRE-family HTH domain